MKKTVLRLLLAVSLMSMSFVGAAGALPATETANTEEVSTIEIQPTEYVTSEVVDQMANPENICIEISLNPPAVRAFKC